MASVLVALLVRGAVAISPRFSVSRFWEEITGFGASRVTLIGRMANQLLELTGGGVPAHRLRTACIVPPPRGGGAFAEHFSVRVVSQYYGSTEMIPMPPDLGQAERPGSCGRPGPGYVCDVVDEEGYPVPAGVVGELVVRPRLPEGMMLGYLDMPEATLEAFRGLWFHTGDAMRRDDEGFYYLEGRLADFVRNRGENIAAHEVEALVEEHPAVVAAAAVGEPDEWGEERLVLYVEPRHGADAGAVIGVVTAHCAAVLPEFMRPYEVVVVPELPRNALGRVEKRRLARPGRSDLRRPS
jgi:crotonobetaine/carnitine-CoA ligase